MPNRSLAALLILILAAPAHAGLFGNNSISVNVNGTKMIEGSGNVSTQTRQVGAFDAVQSKGSFNIDVSIGSPATVSVEIDDNLQGVVRTEVHDGTLVIDSSGSWSSHHDPKVHVTVPALSAVAIDGSGDASLKDLAGADFALRINGSGDVEASGRVASLSVLLNGSGDADLGDLDSTDARVRINGSGDASLKVSRKLEAIINGSGDVSYSGGATVTSSIHGSGSVEKK